MRRAFILASLFLFLTLPSQAGAAAARVIKVLPTFLDLQGRHTIWPGLYDRDTYQAILRQHPDQISGMRFDVQWKAHHNAAAALKLRLELRRIAPGSLPKITVLEKEVKPGGFFGSWTTFFLRGDDYKNEGQVSAWRATLWDGDKLLGEQKSFLW
jgi:hypothetical protein